MNILEKVKSIFASAPAPIDLSRYSESIFRDPKVLEDLKRDGYAITPFLNEEETQSLFQDHLQILKMSADQRTEFFWVSAFSPNIELRNFTKDSLNQKIKPNLGRVFDDSKSDYMGGTFLVKPPTQQGKNDPHQDSAHVDESRFYAVYCWIPLVDINENNDSMCAIKGSHLWGNKYRSTVVPWYYKNVEEALFKYGTPVYMKAGEMLIFDSALIHFTPSNTTPEPRPAINYFVKPKAPALTYYFIDKETPKGKIEEFCLSADFYYTYDWFSRPPMQYRSRVLDNNLPVLDAKKLDRLYKAHLIEN